ncbi:hypothetical protein TNCV_2859461 [Trichonephila clavipes]|nr:hypothetical protein TNCV_2859461 [Trichonephila clavipes]
MRFLGLGKVDHPKRSQGGPSNCRRYPRSSVRISALIKAFVEIPPNGNNCTFQQDPVVILKTDHLIEISTHAPQRPMSVLKTSLLVQPILAFFTTVAYGQGHGLMVSVEEFEPNATEDPPYIGVEGTLSLSRLKVL